MTSVAIVDRAVHQAYGGPIGQQSGDPAETAAGIAFLASPAASYITGAVLDSNGGHTA
ncbi:SDR family oxidoreductase [Micromonospora hortensis]|uniref:SDR family oxidoreductase n=1 Tax=Micromonospora hortensis TaxID=2911209 RepID=UPI001EE8418A|nr:SDR family oxidoreductase [Micromonospora hortensis]MCG5451459.1 SDR family oxidoreductase [Micromonospora hortensis]